jgi:hypothetical protein
VVCPSGKRIIYYVCSFKFAVCTGILFLYDIFFSMIGICCVSIREEILVVIYLLEEK